MPSLKSLALTAALVLAAPMAQAAVVYDDGIVGTNGTYSDVGSKTVTFQNLGGNQTISFTLVGGRSVDGLNVGGYDDFYTVVLNGLTVFKGYFNISGGGTDSVAINTNTWGVTVTKSGNGTFDGGTAAVSGTANFLAGTNTLTFSFATAFGWSQGVEDESWGVNAVNVSGVPTVPVPATLPLLAAGLAGLGLMRRKAR